MCRKKTASDPFATAFHCAISSRVTFTQQVVDETIFIMKVTQCQLANHGIDIGMYNAQLNSILEKSYTCVVLQAC